MKVGIQSEIHPRTLVRQIVSQISRDQLIDLIRFIDKDLVQDVDFTRELCDYFTREMELEQAHEKE